MEVKFASIPPMSDHLDFREHRLIFMLLDDFENGPLGAYFYNPTIDWLLWNEVSVMYSSGMESNPDWDGIIVADDIYDWGGR